MKITATLTAGSMPATPTQEFIGLLDQFLDLLDVLHSNLDEMHTILECNHPTKQAA